MTKQRRNERNEHMQHIFPFRCVTDVFVVEVRETRISETVREWDLVEHMTKGALGHMIP